MWSMKSQISWNKILSDIFKFASFALFLILDNLPEQDGRDQCKSHANPGHNVGPLVFELRVLLQDLREEGCHDIVERKGVMILIISLMLTCGQDWVKSSVSLAVLILFLSQCSTPCHNPIPPALNKPGQKIILLHHEQHHHHDGHTGYEHEDGGGRDVGGGSLPASSDTSGEGDKHEEESDDEESHHGTTHI